MALAAAVIDAAAVHHHSSNACCVRLGINSSSQGFRIDRHAEGCLRIDSRLQRPQDGCPFDTGACQAGSILALHITARFNAKLEPSCFRLAPLLDHEQSDVSLLARVPGPFAHPDACSPVLCILPS
jgi:hypothetical protein